MIELTSVDENGSGKIFPTLLDPKRVIAVVSVENYPELIKGAITMIVVEGTPKPIFTTATYADLREILK